MIHFGVLGCEKWNALHAAPVLASYPCVARARILSGESGTCIHRQNESASEGKMAYNGRISVRLFHSSLEHGAGRGIRGKIA
jgi:hypothetical protein